MGKPSNVMGNDRRLDGFAERLGRSRYQWIYVMTKMR